MSKDRVLMTLKLSIVDIRISLSSRSNRHSMVSAISLARLRSPLPETAILSGRLTCRSSFHVSKPMVAHSVGSTMLVTTWSSALKSKLVVNVLTVSSVNGSRSGMISLSPPVSVAVTRRWLAVQFVV